MRDRRLLTIVLVCTAIVMAGCGKRVPPVATAPPPAPAAVPAPPPAPPPPPPPAPAPAAAATLSEDEIFARKTVDQLNAERPLGDAYFDFNESRIREDARPVLRNNADWLRRWASTRITIEGQCDPRGTAEYNLALGERRADAAKEYLVSLGVPGDRLLAVSKGEESPVCFEETEECWQRNRRAHPIITGK